MAETSPRYSGILLHPTSLPSPYGIGDFGSSAYDFIDFLVKAGQSIWQILPLGPTGYGDSPYQSFCAFAGQPLLISPEKLLEDGLLTQADLDDYPEQNPDLVDYGSVIPAKHALFHRSHEIFLSEASKEIQDAYKKFCKEEAEWLDDYALFMAGKDAHGGKCWLEWEDDLRTPTKAVKAKWKKLLAESVSYYKYLQFLFFRQWARLKQYAADNGIQITGDIPIFVALDSSDVWANRKLFLLESDGYPTVVAGVPPDYFSATGQLWGNPLYDWKYHKKTGYSWWIRRLEGQLRQVDFVRIDHFRGFEQFYAIPYGEKTAIVGEWRPGPAADLFRAFREAFGNDIPIWAEDLGIITPPVEALRDDFGLPGMKVLQFAFGNKKDNDIMPHQFNTSNCICYTGTHDNNTTYGWYQELTPVHQDRIRRYVNSDCSSVHWDMIRIAMGTIAKYSIYPLQDVLGFGSDCRMNTPAVAAGNWTFRFHEEQITDEIALSLRKMTELFGRCEPLPEEEEEDEDEKDTAAAGKDAADAEKIAADAKLPASDPADAVCSTQTEDSVPEGSDQI